MLFIWDPGKASSNLKKHGIAFELASSVLSDPFHLSILERKTKTEQRWVTVGRSADLSTLVVIHLYLEESAENEIVRIISARRATKKEKRQYEEGI